MAGQIVPRGKNVWLVRVFLGRDPDGGRRYLNKTVHGTKKQAQAWLTNALRERDLGVALAPAQQTLDDYLDRWLASAAQARVRPKTFAGYQDVLRRYVRPALGRRPLAKITPVETQALFNKMAGSGLSPRTVQYTHMILKQALQQAIRWRLLTFNPCDGVSLPRQVRREMQALTPDEVRRFLPVAREDRLGALFELALTTGLRPSEYCALKWSDIDLERGTLSVNRSIDYEPGGGWSFAENKTGRSRRTVKLLAGVVCSLAEHKRRQEAERAAAERWADLNLVFTNETGGPVARHNLMRRNLMRILEAAGLPRIRLYDLRHTAATLALSAGTPMKVVSEMLGHGSSALTMDVYAHVQPHMQDDAAVRLERLLEGDGTQENADSKSWHTIGTQRPQ